MFTRLIPNLLIFLFITVLAFPAAAAPVKRKVLVLYVSDGAFPARENFFMEGFALPLNYLGFMYQLIDFNDFDYPDSTEMEKYEAILTSFPDDKMAEPEKFLKWLAEQQKSGKKIIIIGSLGAYTNLENEVVDSALIKEIYSNLGFSWQGNATNDRMKLKYAAIDNKWMNFERKLPVFPYYYAQVVPVSNATSTWVAVSENGKTANGSVVATGPGGGFAFNGYIRWQDPVNYLKQWYLNPFEFLRQSLGLQGMPAFTPTTLNGLRVAFAHIDGDGFAGYTEVDKNKNCGEIIMERIFARYDFPNSASVIAGEIDPDVRGSIDNVELARTLFDMKNVEPSSHTYTHPFAWNAKLRDSKEYDQDFIVGQYEKTGYKFNAKYEIVDSCNYISESLAPAEKPCRVLFWSGMCDPTSEQVAIADNAGLLNLNGGDSVMDSRRNSYFGVSPLYLALGQYNQIFTGQANENILTNLWTGPFFGFRNIVETMKRTESPRRVMPIDIYFHFYSGEKFSSLQALEDVYEWVMNQDTARVYASSYIKMVRGFLTGVINKNDPDHYTFNGYGDCLSVRINSLNKVPDLESCRNVIGYDILPDGVYIHLKPDTKQAELVLTGDNGANSKYIYIKKASGWVRDLTHTANGVRFVFECFSKGKIVFGGVNPDHKYRIIRPDHAATEVGSNGQGILTLRDITSGPVEIVKI
ncbi:polysaccharide deacetylase family protein [Maridesulfovibrio zosterae]|uniref:polysaccharide deacetylase family protein n=1 Tax=Maridesulfovibrio zosterae TaxID=82171 RepID=UPI001FE0845C|nr:polysaccharide deacetylase [Maridesulfovibrio zosterae]